MWYLVSTSSVPSVGLTGQSRLRHTRYPRRCVLQRDVPRVGKFFSIEKAPALLKDRRTRTRLAGRRYSLGGTTWGLRRKLVGGVEDMRDEGQDEPRTVDGEETMVWYTMVPLTRAGSRFGSPSKTSSDIPRPSPPSQHLLSDEMGSGKKQTTCC